MAFHSLHPTRKRRRYANGRWHLASVLALYLTGLAACAHGELTALVNPAEVLVGERAQYVLQSDEAVPRGVELPEVDGLRWVAGPSVNYRQINSERRVWLLYDFVIDAPGEVVIPAATATVNGKKQTSNAVEVKVHERKDSEQTLRDSVYLELTFNGSRTPPDQIYPGQRLALVISAFFARKTEARLAYPELQIEDASLRDYSAANPRNPHFAPPTKERRIIDGVAFDVYKFNTEITALKTGSMTGNIAMQFSVREDWDKSRAANRDFDQRMMDDLFGRRERRIRREITADLPAIQVTPLPQVPEEAGNYLGLIGEWSLGLDSSPAQVAVGEPLTVDLTVTGRGDVQVLNAPPLDVEGFRSYDPEVKHLGNYEEAMAVVTWVLIPLTVDAPAPRLTFSTFDPQQGVYESSTFDIPVSVRPGKETALPDSGASGTADADNGKLAGPPPDSILYLKTERGGTVVRPLWRNTVLAAVVLAVAGVVAGIALAAAALRRELLENNEQYRRRRNALKEKRQIFRHLRRCATHERPHVVRTELVPYLNAVLDLPPGTTPSVLADQIEPRDAELAEMLRRADSAAFAPGNGAVDNEPVQAAGASFDVARMLRRAGRIASMVLVLALGCGFTFLGIAQARADATAGASGKTAFERAVMAYDRGEYEEADLLFSEAQSLTDGISPAILYNRGNCAYFMDEYAKSLEFYERARRLAPRDTDIIENLNFVRGELGLPRVYELQTPGDLIVRTRDFLRPDEWMLVAAVTLGIGGVLTGWLRWRGTHWRPAATVGTIIVIMALYATYKQYQTTYREQGQGIVASQQANVYRLPDRNAEKADFNLRLGEMLEIEEARTDWCRIRAADAQGWIPKDHLRLVW